MNIYLVLFLMLVSALAFLGGANILGHDISIHSFRYCKKLSSRLSLFLFFIFLCFSGYFLVKQIDSIWIVVLFIPISIFSAFVFGFLITKFSPKTAFTSLLYYFVSTVCTMYLVYSQLNIEYAILWCFIYGFYIRNSPLGAPHRQYITLAKSFKEKRDRNIDISRSQAKKSIFFNSFRENPNSSLIQDFSFAGFDYGESDPDALFATFKVYDAKNYGIYPNKSEDCTLKIQNAVDTIGRDGGGILFFSNGIYNVGQHGRFIQINYSKIVIKGESKSTVFVSHSPTLMGEKNPWLSPFVFTTGELLQSSNIFFGVQFKKRKSIITRSASLTDPGSDGSIIEAQYLTKVVEPAYRGDSILVVDDTKSLEGSKYVILALFNDYGNDELIKTLLSVDALREEWKTAKRASDEIAPSFQWLVEVERILDSKRVKLKQPLRVDAKAEFYPELYGVEMLENVGFVNFTLRSKWNGIFRHHGFPIYFSKREAQIMDYGWNGINMKRVSHGLIKDVVIDNFTNPLYVQDARNCTVDKVVIKGSSGHQGIKLYGHSSDNLFCDIFFETCFADMMGGEGNCYGNVFTCIEYNNTENIYVDFDLHGFSEGPFSPPAFNLFELVWGFRGIKGGGALFNQPACAGYNVWWNIFSEGYDRTPDVFVNTCYHKSNKIKQILGVIVRTIVTLVHKKSIGLSFVANTLKENLSKLNNDTSVLRREHFKLFRSSIISGYCTKYPMRIYDSGDNYVYVENFSGHQLSEPISLFGEQRRIRAKLGDQNEIKYDDCNQTTK